jgi:hypothetical protein
MRQVEVVHTLTEKHFSLVEASAKATVTCTKTLWSVQRTYPTSAIRRGSRASLRRNIPRSCCTAEQAFAAYRPGIWAKATRTPPKVDGIVVQERPGKHVYFAGASLHLLAKLLAQVCILENKGVNSLHLMYVFSVIVSAYCGFVSVLTKSR